jgi:hypothetical protein
MSTLIAAIVALALAGDPEAEAFCESYEEPCLGMDGTEANANAEALGVCAYFE